MIPADMLPVVPALRVAPMDDDSRKQWRRKVKIRREEQAAIQRQRLERQALINSVEAEKEAEAERHISLAKPKQDRLRQIVDLQVAEVVDGTPKDPKLEAERIKLQGEIDAANESLREAIRRADDKIKAIREELNKLPMAKPDAVFESELVQLGSPGRVDELFTHYIESYWCNRRLELSQKILEGFNDQIEAAKRRGETPAEGVKEAARKFEFECLTASSAVAAVRQEIERIRAELVAE